jgi:hypothetical protein
MSRLAAVVVLCLAWLPACASTSVEPWLGAPALESSSLSSSVLLAEDDEEWHEPAPIWARLLLWVPNRILDAIDTFSFDVHVGFGVGVDVHVTRAFQAVAMLRGGTAGVGWHWGRSLGVLTRAEAGLAAGPFGFNAGTMAIAGTAGADSGSLTIGGIHSPGDEVYAEEHRDYWAAGASVTAAVVGVDVDVHLGEILDLILGIFLIDIYGDDIGS